MTPRDPMSGLRGFTAAPRRGRGAIVAAVVLLHLLLGLWLQSSWHRGGGAREAQHSSTIRMVTIQLPPLPKAPAATARAETRHPPLAKAREAATPSTSSPPSARSPIAIPPDEPRSTLVLPPQEQVATSPPPAASGPSGRDLMYGAATQRALRQGTQGQPLLSERVDQASQAPERVEASAKLGKEIMKGATTDCLKGEFGGAGMGLLSAPFLLLAEARGKCRR